MKTTLLLIILLYPIIAISGFIQFPWGCTKAENDRHTERESAIKLVDSDSDGVADAKVKIYREKWNTKRHFEREYIPGMAEDFNIKGSYNMLTGFDFCWVIINGKEKIIYRFNYISNPRPTKAALGLLAMLLKKEKLEGQTLVYNNLLSLFPKAKKIREFEKYTLLDL